MKKRYFAGGEEISRIEHSAILQGKRNKKIRCPDGQPGFYLLAYTDHINIIDGKLDESDQLLIAILEEADITLEKTYIVEFFHDSEDFCDPLLHQPAGVVYGYW